MTDPAIETLFLPLASGDIDWPDDGKTLFLRARMGNGLTGVEAKNVDCVQSFRPYAGELEKAGFTVKPAVEASDRDYPLVLVLPPRQREEARALLAAAFSLARRGGTVVVCQSNTEGARTCESDVEKLAGPHLCLSKNKARVIWAKADTAHLNAKLVAEWLPLDAPRPIGDGRFVSRPGLFAWDRIDAGTALLSAHLPMELSGAVADLGAGYGALSAALLDRCPNISMLDLYEAEGRALDLARQNLAAHRLSKDLGAPKLDFFWHDVTAGLTRGNYDAVVMNPPFHEGRADRADIGQAFIHAASGALRSGGELWLVANRHLPYEAGLRQDFTTVATIAEDGGYKVIRALKGRPAGSKR